MGKILIFSILMFSQQGFAGKDCFSDHVKEALDLNHQRAAQYFELDPRTRSVSQKLIAMENLLIPFAFFLDRAAQPYQKNGLGFMCEEFIDIAETPSLVIDIRPSDAPIPKFSKPPGKKSLKKLRRAMKVGDFSTVVEISDLMVRDLHQNFPDHFCLRRHFLESIRRIADLAPRQIYKAKIKRLKSPRGLILDLFKLHSVGLWKARSIDRLAIPLQNQGIAIVCNDVPEVPLSL